MDLPPAAVAAFGTGDARAGGALGATTPPLGEARRQKLASFQMIHCKLLRLDIADKTPHPGSQFHLQTRENTGCGKSPISRIGLVPQSDASNNMQCTVSTCVLRLLMSHVCKIMLTRNTSSRVRSKQGIRLAQAVGRRNRLTHFDCRLARREVRYGRE